MMQGVTFMYPQFFWLLLLLAPAIGWYVWTRNRQTATLKISSAKAFGKTGWANWINPAFFVLRLIALALLVVAMARPRTVDVSNKTKTTKGIDIVMAVDVSSSMLARDLKPNRLTALRKVATNFVNARVNDRIGLVLYAGEAYTRTPVTSDNAVVDEALKDIKYQGNVLQDGTAIGMGLATAINRLKDSKAKSRIVILLTDGVNNTGTIEPETASDIAREYGIKIYTIGIGTNGNAEFPYAIAPNGDFLFRMMPVEIDETLMKKIAKNTGGKYFRATSNSKLSEIYDEINKLETTEIKELRFYDYDEKYRPFALAAGILLLMELALRQTVFRSFI